MKKLLGLVAVLVVLGGTPVYANDAASSGKLLSFIQFSEAPENHGAPQRVLQHRYDDYRQGRFAATTLDAEHIR